MDKTYKDVMWAFDDRRNIALPGSADESLKFSVSRWLILAREAIAEHGVFNCALSGGSTPKALYQALVGYKDALDWTKVRLYFSDERCVPLDNKDSNFLMAWKAGFSQLVAREQIFPMYTTGIPEEAALAYEELVKEVKFDLVMLGMGDDGHTASLFPFTHGLKSKDRLVVANFLPEKEVWRITMTFEEINKAKHINLYVFGASKAPVVKEVLTGEYNPDLLPSQKIGLPDNKALWILDDKAGAMLSQPE